MAAEPRRVAWSPEAEDDLFSIWNYIAQAAGPRTADDIVRRIGEVCRLLEDFPLAGRSRSDIRPGLRSVVSGPFVIFYRAERNMAEIVRVLDGRRDVDDVFSDG